MYIVQIRKWQWHSYRRQTEKLYRNGIYLTLKFFTFPTQRYMRNLRITTLPAKQLILCTNADIDSS